MSETKLSDEIRAIAAIEDALTPLQEEVRGRVLRWAVDRYKVSMPSRRATGTPISGSDEDGEDREDSDAEAPSAGPTSRYETFAEFYAAAGPKTDPERVLVAAYWFTEREGWTDLQSRPLNQELRNLGHAVNHMPTAFSSLTERKPQHVVQLRKSGKSRQAHVRYKLTAEGKAAVERLLFGAQAKQ